MTLPLDHRGFSLVEIMIVVGIAGALVTAGAVSFIPQSERSQFTEQRGKMYEALIRARSIANSRRECVVVTVEGRLAKVEAFVPGPGSSCEEPFDSTTIEPLNFMFLSSISFGGFSNGESRLIFLPTGGLRDEQVVTLDMSNDKGQTARFRIYPAIGQVRVN